MCFMRKYYTLCKLHASTDQELLSIEHYECIKLADKILGWVKENENNVDKIGAIIKLVVKML